MNKKITLSALAVFAAVSAFAYDVPTISNVTMSQDTSRLVTIGYHIDRPGIVTIDILTNGVSIGAENIRPQVADTLYSSSQLTGDVHRYVEEGDRVIYWKPNKTWPGHVVTDASVSVRVTAWSPSAPPDCLVVSLDRPLDSVRFYPSVDWCPGGFVSNDVYKTSKLVMVKIPAANVQWRMGDDDAVSDYRYVTLTEDYYMGVYELTKAQYKQLVGSYSIAEGEDMRPVGNVTFNDMRGAATAGADYDWPDKGHAVRSDSFIGKLRAHAGDLLEFDLPTLAQWQFACRAGAKERMFFGSDTEDGLADYAWYVVNSSGVMHDVGLKRPNPFGLYDIYGNAYEWVLDWYCTYREMLNLKADDPTGPQTTTDVEWHKKCRLIAGGGYDSAWGYCTSSRLGNNDVDNCWGSYYRGFRLMCPARVEK